MMHRTLCPPRHRAAFLGEPTPVVLGRGERLYKLVSLPLVRDRVLQSPWWIRQAAFTELLSRARRLGRPVSELVRAQLAVTVEWSPGLDTLWVVQLASDVVAWEGRAQSQRVVLGDPAAFFIGGGMQLCVPDLTWRQVAVDHTAHIAR